MSRRWRYPRSRRGVFYGPLATPEVPAPPSYVPAFQEPSGRSSRLVGMRPRRGLFLPVLPSVSPPPGQVRRFTVRLMSARRGKFFTVPIAVAVTAAPWVPAPLDAARRTPSRPTRRGKFLAVPPAVAPAAIPWVPPFVDPSRRVLVRPARHGRFYAVPPQAAPWIPPLLDPARRASARPSRRGEFFAIPLVGASPPQVAAVPSLPSRRPRLLFNRRGHFWTPPPAQQILPAPSWVPPIVRARRTPVRPTRRGEYLLVPSVRVDCPGRITSRRPRLLALTRSQLLWTPPPLAPPLPYVPPTDVTATVRDLVSTAAAMDVAPTSVPRDSQASAAARSFVSTATTRSPE